MANVMHTLTNVAGQNQLSAENAEFYNRNLLEALTAETMLVKYAEKSTSIPKNSGDTISFRRYNNIDQSAYSLDALTEGVTPNAITSTVSKISTSVKQYGDFLMVTDVLNLVGLDNNIVELSNVLGRQAGEKTERIVQQTIYAGTNVLYGGAKTSRATITATDVFTTDLLLRIATIMKDNKVKPVDLGEGYGKGYPILVSTKQAYDLKKDKLWIDAQVNNGNQKGLIDGYVGKMFGIHVIEYDMAPFYDNAGASGADVYGAICFGQGAFGIPDIENSSSPRMIIKNSEGNSADTSNPLNLYSTVGWKSLFGVIRLQELALLRVETSSSF